MGPPSCGAQPALNKEKEQKEVELSYVGVRPKSDERRERKQKLHKREEKKGRGLQLCGFDSNAKY